MIRRIKVNIVIFTCLDFGKVHRAQFGTAQSHMADAQDIRLTNRGLGRTANRHVELAPAIHSPQAVVTGFVEVDEASRAFNRLFEIVFASKGIIVFLAVLLSVIVQRYYQRLDIVLNDSVGGDEIKVDIT